MPLYERMHAHLLKQEILHADETELQVLHEPGCSPTSKSFLWLYRTGRAGPAIVLYDYRTTRANKHPRQFLKGFKGYLHIDGYSGYNNLPDITLVGCWAHARRGFVNALKAFKNWLFSNTPRGARASATIYSIVETAKENGLNPFAYLTFLFERLPNIDIDDEAVLDEFLPWSALCRQNAR